MKAPFVVFLVAVVAVATSALGQEEQEVSPESLGDPSDRLASYLQIQMPAGEGPFPAMIMVTGCSGFHNERFSASYDRDGNNFVEMGYAVARADYVRAHGLDNSCTGAQNPSGEVVAPNEIAQYIRTTVTLMAERDQVNEDRIYLIGWSLGGTGILTALADADGESRLKVAGVVNYFPGCRDVDPLTADVPMLLLLAGLDNITPPEYCRDLVRISSGRDVIEVIEYPAAHHCFIAEDTPVIRGPRSEATCAYNPEAHAKSWRDVVTFLSSL
jgi:dienelactone hydrolase